MMPFSIRMAWRETRAAWRHFLYFFICIALGVGALVGVGLFAAGVDRTVRQEARALMGGDVEVRLSRPISAGGQAVLRNLASRGIATTHVSELVAMASGTIDDQPRLREGGAPTQLIELKAVEPGYPFYGSITTVPEAPLAELLAVRRCGDAAAATECFGAVVQEALLIKMRLSVGQPIKIGQANFRIAGVVKQEPDRVVSAFSLGPRVFISQEALRAADLVKPGSRVRERHLLRLPAGLPPDPLVSHLRVELAPDSARVSTFHDAQPQLRRFLDQLARYLGLIGLTALFVGGIGVASTIHAFVKDKQKTIAILKTLGAESTVVVRTYLVQALFLGLLGSTAGIVIGIAVQHAVPGLLAALLPVDFLSMAAGQRQVTAGPIVRGVALGVATTVLFALWPLLGVRDVRPALIFRSDTIGPGGAVNGTSIWRRMLSDRLRIGTAAVIVSGLAAVAVWEAASLTVGLIFIGALLAAVIGLFMAATLLVRLLTLISPPAPLAVRYALGNVSRPGSQTVGIMVAVGIGVMIITAISMLERSLVAQIGESRPVNAPTFFFIDIQPDQRDELDHLLLARWPETRPEFTPLVRSRLHAVNGTVVALNEDDDAAARKGRKGAEHGRSWYLTREYVLTFLDRLPKDNTIVNGHWWDRTAPSEIAQVSVEEEAARHLGVGIGSTIEFDIQGTVLSARVSSIRRVEWNNFSTNFYMILSPGSLDGAPFTYVATVRVPSEQEAPVQQAVVQTFPNVTAINIGEVVTTFARVLEQLAVAIRAMALFCLVAGTIVMAAALATTRYRRLYESVVFKALGATRMLIVGSFAAEYAMIGVVAGFIGLGLGSLLSWIVLVWIFDLTWTFHAEVAVVGFLLTVALTVAVGFLATFRILGQRPLAILRQE